VVELKGQLTIQYLASFIFFIGLIIYIYFAYSANLPAFVEEVRKEDVRSKAFQLSEILLNDPGEPIDWNKTTQINEIRRIGFSDHYSNKNNLILKSKIDAFNSHWGGSCSSPSKYEEIQKKLALNQPFSILIFNITENGERKLLLDCVSYDFPKTSINATIKRITALNNSGVIELAEIIVQM